MPPVARALIAFLATWFCPRLSLQLQIVALRHQLTVYQRSVSRPRLRPADRIFWSWLSRHWSRWRDVLVQPATVIAWQRKRFRDHWTHISGKGKPGRPPISQDMRELIRKISVANPRWGSPRIQGELHKLGIEVAKSTVEKYRVRRPTPPSPARKAFLKNHVGELVSIDFFTVPTVGFRVLFVLVVLAHERRQVIHFNVTENPTAHWTAQKIVEAFPWDSASKYLPRDRDAIYGEPFRRRVRSMAIEQVRSSPRSPWQNPYVERLIGSIRRDCLDHVIVLNERHLRRILTLYLDYYHRWRTHLSLDMDCLLTRSRDHGVPFGEHRGGDFRKYGKLFGATLDLPGFERLYWPRVNGSKAVVPKSVDDAFAHPETDGESTLLRKSARGLTL